MQLAEEVRAFSVACEQILSAIAMNRPLTPEEATMIDYYCVEIRETIEHILPKAS